MIRVVDFKSLTCNESSTTGAALRHLLGRDYPSLLTPGELRLAESIHWMSKSHGKGTALMAQAENPCAVSVLLSGWAFRFQALPDGRRQILDFAFAGTIFGFGAGTSRSYGVEAVTECVSATLPKTQFTRLLLGCPPLALHVAEQVAESERRAYEHMTSIGRRSARARVAALIVELMLRTRASEFCGRDGAFELPVSQSMIGDALGLSNEHVCRTMAKLVQDGICASGRHTLRVLKPAEISRIAGCDFPGEASHSPNDMRAA